MKPLIMAQQLHYLMQGILAETTTSTVKVAVSVLVLAIDASVWSVEIKHSLDCVPASRTI